MNNRRVVLLRHPNGGDSDNIAMLEFIAHFTASLVDADLAFSNYPINMGFGDPFEQVNQEIVHTLTGVRVINFQKLNVLKGLLSWDIHVRNDSNIC